MKIIMPHSLIVGTAVLFSVTLTLSNAGPYASLLRLVKERVVVEPFAVKLYV